MRALGNIQEQLRLCALSPGENGQLVDAVRALTEHVASLREDLEEAHRRLDVLSRDTQRQGEDSEGRSG